MRSLKQIIQEHGPIIWTDDIYMVAFDEQLDITIFKDNLKCNFDFLDIDFSAYDNLRDIGKEALHQYYRSINYGIESQ